MVRSTNALGYVHNLGALLPRCVEDYVEAENPVRVIEAFVEQLDLRVMGFDGIDPEATGRPAYHPAVLLKIYLYGYLNRVQSSWRLEQETQRNLRTATVLAAARTDRLRRANLADALILLCGITVLTFDVTGILG